MNCPECAGATTVLRTETRHKDARTKRLRVCGGCRKEFATVEVLQSTELLRASFDRLRELVGARRDIDKMIEEIVGKTWSEPTTGPKSRRHGR